MKKVDREPHTGGQPAAAAPVAAATTADNHAAGVTGERPGSRNPIVQQPQPASQPAAAAASSQSPVPQPAAGGEFHLRTSGAQGVRNQQESSFNLSGEWKDYASITLISVVNSLLFQHLSLVFLFLC